MAQGYMAPPAMPPMAAAPAPAIKQYTEAEYKDTETVPARLKTNAEWLEDAQFLADKASQALLHRATIDRLHTLHHEMMALFISGQPVDQDMLHEYCTLAS